ncbi:MAG: hypothetical protein LBL92_01305, partial [Propionibacteriaceae bacterium]|nr:hypothetical protein [Propionibacteriaceae bacterium]
MTDPLAGFSVLIARTPDRAADLRSQLQALGATVTVAPVTTTLSASDPNRLDAVVRQIWAG